MDKELKTTCIVLVIFVMLFVLVLFIRTIYNSEVTKVYTSMPDYDAYIMKHSRIILCTTENCRVSEVGLTNEPVSILKHGRVIDCTDEGCRVTDSGMTTEPVYIFRHGKKIYCTTENCKVID